MYTRETSGIEGNSIHVYVNKIALQGFRFCYGFPGAKSFGDFREICPGYLNMGRGRGGGVIAFVFGTIGSGSSLGTRHVVFLGIRTLLSQCLFPPRYINE